MSPDAAWALTRTYPVGSILFEEHDPGTRMFVIRDGKVKIFRRSTDTQVVLAFLGPGDFFGEMALLEQLPRSASAEVIEEAKLIEVDQSTFEQMIRSNSEITVRIMRKLASRVRELDVRVEKLLYDSMLGRAVEVLRWLLPQGTAEGKFSRIRGEAAKVDITAQAGIPPGQGTRVLNMLIKSGCLRTDGEDLLVAHTEVLDQFSAYLSLKQRYEPAALDLPAEAVGLGDGADPAAQQSIARLMRSLKMSTEDFESRQSVLAEQYRHFVALGQRFGFDEGPQK